MAKRIGRVKRVRVELVKEKTVPCEFDVLNDSKSAAAFYFA